MQRSRTPYQFKKQLQMKQYLGNRRLEDKRVRIMFFLVEVLYLAKNL